MICTADMRCCCCGCLVFMARKLNAPTLTQRMKVCVHVDTNKNGKKLFYFASAYAMRAALAKLG